MSYWAHMTKSASIVEPSTSTDDANVVTRDDTATAVTSRCYLFPLSGRAAQDDYARSLGAEYVMFVPRETSIGPETANGLSWKVTVDSVIYHTVWVQDMAAKDKVKKVYLRLAV